MVTYYAVVNDFSSRERPAGVFRRTYTEDEANQIVARIRARVTGQSTAKDA